MAAQRKPDEYNQPEPGGGRELTIMEHLQELRNRMFISAVAIVIGTVIGLIISFRAIDFLLQPGRDALPTFKPIFTDVFENTGVYFKVAILIGLMISMPVLVYEILAFVVPALTTSEKKWVFPILFGAVGLFLVGVAFSYYVVVPSALKFLLNWGHSVAEPTIRIGLYIDFVVRLVFWVGVFFELPIIMLAPAKFGIISAKRYLKWWRYAVVLGFLAAAAVIPNINPLQQIVVAAPIIALYFAGCGLAWLVQPKKSNSVG
jgi:sec-independent protein translocase protein TatC